MNTTAAQQLAQWLEVTHPALFAALHQRVSNLQMANSLRNASLRGFGDDSEAFDLTQSDITGDGTGGISTVTITADTNALTSVSPTIDITPISAGDLATPGVSAAFGPSSDLSQSIPIAGSGGFLQSIGAGIGSAAASVGNFLTSNQGLSDLTKLGTAYFQLQNNKTNAQLQTAVLNAQVARIQSGNSALPITYARAPNGQMVPVYTSSALASQGVYPSNMPIALQGAIQAGQSQLITLPDGTTGYTVPPTIVGGLSTNISLSQWLPWLLAIGAGLILLRGTGR